MDKLKMKRRFADARGTTDILKKKYTNLPINTEKFKGNISLLEILEVKKEWKVDIEQRCILANGYKWLEIYQENKNYCITAMYNEKNELVEWYIDVTDKIGMENGVPYEEDLYLDVIVLPNGRIFLLDEEELENAYKDKLVTKKQYELAYKVANKIMENAKNKIDELKLFSDKYLKILELESNN